MRYYCSLYAIIFAIFDFFDNFFENLKNYTNKLYTVFNQDEAAKQ